MLFQFVATDTWELHNGSSTSFFSSGIQKIVKFARMKDWSIALNVDLIFNSYFCRPSTGVQWRDFTRTLTVHAAAALSVLTALCHAVTLTALCHDAILPALCHAVVLTGSWDAVTIPFSISSSLNSNLHLQLKIKRQKRCISRRKIGTMSSYCLLKCVNLSIARRFLHVINYFIIIVSPIFKFAMHGRYPFTNGNLGEIRFRTSGPNGCCWVNRSSP